MKYIITILLFFSSCTPKPKPVQVTAPQPIQQPAPPVQTPQPEKVTGYFSVITIGGTRITGVKNVFDADSLSSEKLVTVGLLYKSIKGNNTTLYLDPVSLIGKGTKADLLRVNPTFIIQKGNSATIKANAKEGEVWYNTETHTMIFHNGYGLRSINSSDVP